METNSETIQKKLYYLTQNLTDMHSNLKSYEIQLRIPLENLSMIGELPSNPTQLRFIIFKSVINQLSANLLIKDPNIFEIIKGLIDCQNATEKNLQQQRNEQIASYQREIEVYTRTLSESELAHTVALARIQHEKTMREIDKGIVLQLDEAVTEQQTTLYALKIPGFYVSSERKAIETQMHLFNFLKELLRVRGFLDNIR